VEGSVIVCLDESGNDSYKMAESQGLLTTEPGGDTEGYLGFWNDERGLMCMYSVGEVFA